MKSTHGLLGTVRSELILSYQYTDAINIQVAYQPGPGAEPVYALEGSSKLTNQFLPRVTGVKDRVV